MYLNLSDIYTIQLDHTSRCNLRCPQCARTTDTGGINPKLSPGRDLQIDDYKLILEPFREREIKIFHCGNFGDAIASPTFLETLEFAQEFVPKSRFSIVTNGSLRTPDWWGHLAKVLTKNPQNCVVFSIDGLADTNGIYRVGSNFEKIMENLQAFNDAGGISRWDYLVFGHNAHQVDEARALALKLGVSAFNVKQTSRFVTSERESYSSEVQNKKTKIVDVRDNMNATAFENIKKSFSSFSEYAAGTPISCKYQKQRSLFVDFEMRVWPCCWMATPLFSMDPDDIQRLHLQKVFSKFGHDFNRLDIHGWELLKNEYFSNYLEKSWEKNFADPETPRAFTCGRTCGQKFEFSSGYGKNKDLEPISKSFVNP